MQCVITYKQIKPPTLNRPPGLTAPLPLALLWSVHFTGGEKYAIPHQHKFDWSPGSSTFMAAVKASISHFASKSSISTQLSACPVFQQGPAPNAQTGSWGVELSYLKLIGRPKLMLYSKIAWEQSTLRKIDGHIALLQVWTVGGTLKIVLR